MTMGFTTENETKEFKIPKEEEIINIRKRIIVESSNDKLVEIYYEALEGIVYKEDLELIKSEFKKRNIKIPYDHTRKESLNAGWGIMGIISLISMIGIVWLEILLGIQNKLSGNQRLFLFIPFALLILIGVINLFILFVKSENPMKALIYNFKNFQ